MDCRDDPTEHRHTNKEHASRPHSETEARAARAVHQALSLDPGKLFRKLPGAAGIKEPLKFSGEATTGFGGGVKPPDRTATQRQVTLSWETLDDGGSL